MIEKKLDAPEGKRYWHEVRRVASRVKSLEPWKREYPVTRHSKELLERQKAQHPPKRK